MNQVHKKATFALVGCGRVARHHLRALDHHAGGAELVAVCDPDPDQLAEATGQTGAAGYESLEALLAEMTPDVVVLSSPSGLHPEQAEMAARAGCHVMCEKPIATHFEDGARMVAACKEAGVELFVVKQLRYNPTLRLLHRALQEERFGQVHLVDVDVFWTRPQAYYDRDAWRGTRDLDGGAFLNQTSHYVDLLCWLFGPVESVHGYMATLGRDIEVEDSGTLSLRWQSGALGSMSVTMLTYPENLRASMTIAGSRGTAVLGGKACDEIEVWRFDDDYETPDEIAMLNQETREFYGDGHLSYYANVLDVLAGKAEPDTDGVAGLESLEVICAGYRSAQEGVRVELPL
ncbi:Gfo/Idh/MocA family oxidoreductase [Persicimonas caeni]|uniref:Gfo/Idh/MocA family oxidoreductase n=1 Tax=Persicimonas caeni TaxID=2292766 RepID=A0A4Y6PTS3_PERCE|nr:Gfo/Idh/MocA family oxidoreductase [Persicimonas caeni]QDG51721.1 Gfo/Idh/MocA family oxidoreductase [Persicimonas caeni]QED32942.1 Gfo/Idh/MocA family oxidoreductase [Persicimonas caeni]